MTQARAHTVSTEQHGMYHCVTRCVRRAWLCGVDPLTGRDHNARKPMIVNRIRELGEIFAVAVYAYAVMSNHLHVVLSVEPELARAWTDDDVADRWGRLFPLSDPERPRPRGASGWSRWPACIASGSAICPGS